MSCGINIGIDDRAFTALEWMLGQIILQEYYIQQEPTLIEKIVDKFLRIRNV